MQAMPTMHETMPQPLPKMPFSRRQVFLSGRAAIYEWKMKHTITAAAAFRMHHVSSVLIDLISVNCAKAQSNWLVTTSIGTDLAGRYQDQLLQTYHGWCIAHRQVEILWAPRTASCARNIRSNARRA